MRVKRERLQPLILPHFNYLQINRHYGLLHAAIAFNKDWLNPYQENDAAQDRHNQVIAIMLEMYWFELCMENEYQV